MKNKTKKSKPSVALKALRLACVVLLAIFPVVTTSAADSEPAPLHWQTLGESPYKPNVLQLLKSDLDVLRDNGHDPLKLVYVAAKDVNDDGRNELFVTSGFQPFSGSEGGWVGLYSPTTRGEYREIYYAVITDYSPRILSSTTNGFHDLVAWKFLVTYEDGAYKMTKHIDPAKYHLGKELSPENLLPQIWEQCCPGSN